MTGEAARGFLIPGFSLVSCIPWANYLISLYGFAYSKAGVVNIYLIGLL